MLSMLSVACWLVLEQCLKLQVQLNDEGSLAGLPVVLNAQVIHSFFHLQSAVEAAVFLTSGAINDPSSLHAFAIAAAMSHLSCSKWLGAVSIAEASDLPSYSHDCLAALFILMRRPCCAALVSCATIRSVSAAAAAARTLLPAAGAAAGDILLAGFRACQPAPAAGETLLSIVEHAFRIKASILHRAGQAHGQLEACRRCSWGGSEAGQIRHALGCAH